MSNFYNNLKLKLSTLNRGSYILIAIIILGIFLRTYHFQQWLYFYPDQARDVTIVDDYLAGKTSLPLLGFKAASTEFKLGAMYSYFQIVSAKIFGVSPATVAYPDVFFGILSIPLCYYFLKKYFSVNVAIVLSGFYSISFYVIRYSRFAWNSNPIPFFALIFMLTLLEFLHAKQRVDWKWIIMLGVATGIGVQLHTVVLILMSLTLLGAFVYLRGNNKKLWKKWAAIFFMIIILNVGQIVSEFRTGFGNSKDFFSVLNDRSSEDSGSIMQNFSLNVVCHSQANILFLTSLENNDDCDSLKYLAGAQNFDKKTHEQGIAIAAVCVGFAILVVGYLLLFYFLRSEKDEKKRIFLGLNIFYGLLAFFIILPIIGHNGQVRYWLPIVFLPFIFLGLIWQYLKEKISEKYAYVFILVGIAIVALNFSAIYFEVKKLFSKNRSDAQYVVLDELNEIKQYIISESWPQKSAYVYGGQKYIQNFYKPFFYVASKDDFNIIRGGRRGDDIPSGSFIFFIGNNPLEENYVKYSAHPAEAGLKADDYKIFGNIAIYKNIKE